MLDYKLPIKFKAVSEVEIKWRQKACAKEPETVKWIESFPPDSVFCDVGANTGAYSLVAAALGHAAYAIEPHPGNAARLAENVLLNVELPGDVLVVPFGVGPTSAPRPFLLNDGTIGSSGSDFKMGGYNIVCLSLDDLIEVMRLPWPNFLKVDTDGSEVQVLKGALKTLQNVTSVLVEINDRTFTRKPIHDICEGAGLVYTDSHKRSDLQFNLLFSRPESAQEKLKADPLAPPPSTTSPA